MVFRKTAIIIFVLLVLLQSSLLGAVHSISPDDLRHWQQIVGDNDFSAILHLTSDRKLPPWPSVHSVSNTLDLSDVDAKQQEKLRDLAYQMAVQLQTYEKQLNTMKTASFHKECANLFAFRNHLMKHLGYINMVLADALNRTTFVHMTRRLIVQNDLSVEMNANIKTLSSYSCPPGKIRAMMQTEIGKHFTSVETKGDEYYQYMSLVHQFYKKEVLVQYIRQFQKSGTFQLLQERDLFLLLWRCIITESRIKTMLPLVARYKHQSKHKEALVSRKDIKQEFASTDLSAFRSAGAIVLKLEKPEIAIYKLFKEVQTERLEAFLQFDTSLDGLMKAKAKACRVLAERISPVENCLKNIRIIHWAKLQAALVLQKKKGDKLTVDEIRHYLPNNKIPICPEDGLYSVNSIGSAPQCSVHVHVGVKNK